MAAKLLRFVKCISPGALSAEDVVTNLGPDYLAVNGSWDGPGIPLIDPETSEPYDPEQLSTEGEWAMPHLRVVSAASIRATGS